MRSCVIREGTRLITFHVEAFGPAYELLPQPVKPLACSEVCMDEFCFFRLMQTKDRHEINVT